MLVHHQFRWSHLQRLHLDGGEELEMVLLLTICAGLGADIPRSAQAHSGH